MLPKLLLLVSLAAICSISVVAAATSSAEATDALHAAARTNNVEAAKEAITGGADLNARGSGGQTPIMAATLTGSADVVRYLLQEHKEKVDLTIGEKDGYTPMHGAGFQGRADVGRLLLKAGVNPSDRHKDGYTPIHRACWGNQARHTDTVKMFLEDGKVDVNELSNGMTPLDSAYMAGNDATVELIKARGGRTAAQLETEKGEL